jgi:hypothetical protein
VEITPCALLLAFFPSALVEPCFEGWRKHASEHDHRGHNNFCQQDVYEAHRILDEDGSAGSASQGPPLACSAQSHGHSQVPVMLIAHAWFGGVPNAQGLMLRGWHCITAVKTHTKHFCKNEQ